MAEKTLIELRPALEEIKTMQKSLQDKAEELANQIMVRQAKEEQRDGSNSR